MSLFDPSRPIPPGVRTHEFLLRPIEVSDAMRDHDAVMETREELRIWEQSSWPEDDFTVEANRADLVELARRHVERRACTYTVVDLEERDAWGCVYVFPVTARFLMNAEVTALGSDRWEDVDAVVYFWVRRSQSARGVDTRLLATLRSWFAEEWGFERTAFVTNERYERQLRLLRGTDLTVRFELREPDKPGAYLVFV